MRMRRNTASAVLCFLPLAVCFFPAGSTRAATTPALGHFPAIEATSLDGARRKLPQDFAGRLNLVVISFAREQQKQVDTWLPVARKIQSAHADFSYCELPTMSRENLLYRWWFNAALRSDTGDRAMRNRILTAYLNKRKFRKALEISSEKQIVAVLVDKTGKVYWRSDGIAGDSAKQSLQAVLSANGM